jgi:hypothetical protein
MEDPDPEVCPVFPHCSSQLTIRSLTVRQKKILQAFADDFEGRPSDIHFGPLPTTPSSEPESPSKPPPPPTGKAPPPPPRAPFVETQPKKSPPIAEDEGFIHTLASGVGKVIGWAERFLGNGEKKK